MMVAWYLHRVVLPPRWTSLLVCALIIGAPVGLIVLQPDLGTGMLVAASGAFTLFLAGIAWWRIGLFAGLGISALPVAWMFLMPYQKDRILMFVNPESDPLGAGWNIIQSKIAIGSGGWFGKGWGQGSQAHLDFLPEHTTDFAFSVLSEEWGWLGVSVLFALYLFIVGRSLWIAANARDGYSRLLAGALAMTFSVYVLVNGSMVVGLLPVVGVPMPLLSYGGTSAVSLLAGFGVIMSVRAHRKFMS
jgi:rod shape determining protein RodA